jgi:ribosome recycling factor
VLREEGEESVLVSVEFCLSLHRQLLLDIVRGQSADCCLAILDGIKIDIGEGAGSQSLNSLASITTKANTLLVSVWDESVGLQLYPS